jgi:hypothetical protein
VWTYLEIGVKFASFLSEGKTYREGKGKIWQAKDVKFRKDQDKLR